ncbi:hypothetical protein IC582_025410 [Cucumis melo]
MAGLSVVNISKPTLCSFLGKFLNLFNSHMGILAYSHITANSIQEKMYYLHEREEEMQNLNRSTNTKMA